MPRTCSDPIQSGWGRRGRDQGQALPFSIPRVSLSAPAQWECHLVSSATWLQTASILPSPFPLILVSRSLDPTLLFWVTTWWKTGIGLAWTWNFSIRADICCSFSHIALSSRIFLMNWNVKIVWWHFRLILSSRPLQKSEWVYLRMLAIQNVKKVSIIVLTSTFSDMNLTIFLMVFCIHYQHLPLTWKKKKSISFKIQKAFAVL